MSSTGCGDWVEYGNFANWAGYSQSRWELARDVTCWYPELGKGSLHSFSILERRRVSLTIRFESQDRMVLLTCKENDRLRLSKELRVRYKDSSFAISMETRNRQSKPLLFREDYPVVAAGVSAKKQTMENAELRASVAERRINKLVHFTRLSNVSGILQYGLLSIHELDVRKLKYDPNDPRRLEHEPNAVCLSIEFPNYKMFYSLRRARNDTWAVLTIRPAVIWTLPCAFCYTNAASRLVSCINKHELSNKAAFDRMFAEKVRETKRDGGIPSAYTTDPQAEILVFDPVLPCDILEVHVKPGTEEKDLHGLTGNRIVTSGKYFRSRKDHKLWSGKNDPEGGSYAEDEEVPF